MTLHAILATDLRRVPSGRHGDGGLKVRDVLRLMVEDGWVQVRQRGSHRQFKHPTKPGLVTLAGKPGDDLAAGSLASVLKQAGLDEVPRGG